MLAVNEDQEINNNNKKCFYTYIKDVAIILIPYGTVIGTIILICFLV